MQIPDEVLAWAIDETKAWIEEQSVGVMTFAPGMPPSLELATTKAVHGQRWFTVAVRTVPHATTR